MYCDILSIDSGVLMLFFIKFVVDKFVVYVEGR